MNGNKTKDMVGVKSSTTLAKWFTMAILKKVVSLRTEIKHIDVIYNKLILFIWISFIYIRCNSLFILNFRRLLGRSCLKRHGSHLCNLLFLSGFLGLRLGSIFVRKLPQGGKLN